MTLTPALAADLPFRDLRADASPARAPRRRQRQLRGAAAFVAHYLWARASAFATLLALVTLAAACAVGVQYAMKLLVDALAGAPQSRRVEDALIVFLALIAGETVLWRLSGWLGARTTIRSGVDIRADLFEHLSGHPMRWHQDHLAGALGHRVSAMAGHFGAVCNRLMWEITPPVVNFIGAIVIFAAIDWRLAATVAALTGLSTAGMLTLGLRGAPLHRAHAEESGRVGGELIDVLSNMWPVKAFSAAKRERARLVEAFNREAAAHQSSSLFTEGVRAVNDVALLVSAAATLFLALALWRMGRVSAGDVVVVSALTFRLLHGSRDLAFSLIGLGQSWTYIDESLDLLGRPHAIADAPDARRFIRCGGAVRLDKVSFRYRDAGRPVLDRIDLSIPAGQRVGIVGASGAGKSTVLGLVLRLYDVESGRLLVDGQDVRSVRQDELRAAIATVPQEVSLFHRTLRENIRFGRPDASDEEVEAAARAAFCDEFIRALPEGYDTLVGERGAKLSGGQRQRIGVARAFLKEAPIVLLDEATSALDTRAEIEVQRALDRLMQGRTVLAVAHRLSTLSGFDRIVVMQNGRVVEDGAPLELRRRGGAFDHMWRLQAEGLDLPLAA
ncbi:MAG: ABC transporter ATP-binding protein [Caulobacteraceae bacterium]|nr:ABC transporter ATP-binding protein [Caulobacter sp.]